MTASDSRPAAREEPEEQGRDDRDEVADVRNEAANEGEQPPQQGTGDLQDNQDQPVEEALGDSKDGGGDHVPADAAAKAVERGDHGRPVVIQMGQRAGMREPSTAMRISIVRMITRLPTMLVMFPRTPRGSR